MNPLHVYIFGFAFSIIALTLIIAWRVSVAYGKGIDDLRNTITSFIEGNTNG